MESYPYHIESICPTQLSYIPNNRYGQISQVKARTKGFTLFQPMPSPVTFLFTACKQQGETGEPYKLKVCGDSANQRVKTNAHSFLHCIELQYKC